VAHAARYGARSTVSMYQRLRASWAIVARIAGALDTLLGVRISAIPSRLSTRVKARVKASLVFSNWTGLALLH
jgi:hypothetical protein